MKGYLYEITNKINGKKYIGKTVNIEKRIYDHFYWLRKNQHHSQKLQNAFNKYGENNFKVDIEMVEVETEEDLSILEIKKIQKLDTYRNGYNETLGGDGNKTFFDWESSILIYNILQRYNGVGTIIANYFHCDKDVVQRIGKNSIYAEEPFLEEKLQQLINEIKIPEQLKKENNCYNIANYNRRKLSREQCLEVLSVILNKKGYDKTICEIFDITSKMTDRLKKKEIYLDCIQIYEQMTDEEKKQLCEKTFNQYNVEAVHSARLRRGTHNQLTQEMVNYILDNQQKTNVSLAADLNISADRVAGIKKHKYYKDLINSYYQTH